ncbi:MULTISPECIES: FtsW/RodA/SpoVE family cell cycle protein [unclassified Blautia]|uniref:FtsW/RodA/SpoVE family cell cycle protein n=1 Tax=unclassified Blautia TaxID=2648079 RepID=UPI000B39F50C|nr:MULTISPECIES: FtsW/RodA/SpoVE family cell cycle protein [unclassified Blautia]OUN29241.1 rod shape-determining protein RodA [Blautia sp. An81]OUN94341.1 rod shape-determining protein RodA [Blautia sp. An46]
MIRLYKLRDYDFRLVIALVVLSTIGVLLVGSADASLQNRQLMGLILGLAAMVVVSLMDFSWILNFSWVIYFLNILLLLAVRLFGNDANGATRWISIGGFTFQPTELAKIVIILFFARFFMEHEEDLNTLRTIVKSIILLAVPLALIYIQPDLKNTLTIVILFCMIIYMAGLSYKIIGGGLLVVIPLVIVFLFIIMQPNQSLIPDYQRNRIMSFLNSEEDEYSDSVLQQENSVMAIGSGQLTGKGLNNNEVSSANNGNFVSENQTDFIFSVAGEELGFIGCAAIILLLLFIIFECIRISLRAKDLSGKLICCGMGALIGIQSFINIGVVTNILPNTGTPLPFVSYGLTSMVSLYIGMGLVLNVGLQRYKKYREVDES